MAKRKSKTMDPEADPNAEIREKHSQMLAEAEALEEEQIAWRSILMDGTVLPKLLAQYEADCEREKEELVDAKGDDVKRLQADIRARQRLCAMIREKADRERVNDAFKAADDYWAQNALFLEGAENNADLETPDADQG